MPNLSHFRFWCQSVLPLVYDDSLSYYEVLCKVVEYINNLIDTDKEIFEDIDELKNEMTIVQNWINNFDSSVIEELLEKYIVTGVYFGLTQSGYFVAYIPDSWDEIVFNTTQYDIFIEGFTEYGHLVLSFN